MMKFRAIFSLPKQNRTTQQTTFFYEMNVQCLTKKCELRHVVIVTFIAHVSK